MLQAIALRRVYDQAAPAQKVALRGLNLHIPAGEIFCLLGANGAGKTTTIHLFMGFLTPTSGQALIHGVDVHAHLNETKKWIAYIPENVMLYPNLTGLENLAYFSGLSAKRYTPSQLRDFFQQAGLQAEAQQQKVGTYSKGMRQKVGIAIALAKQAKALFLDEPTSGLDPLASNEFSSLIKRLSGEGIAILMATHDLFRAKETGGRIGIMKAGELVKVMKSTEYSHLELEQIYLETIRTQLV